MPLDCAWHGDRPAESLIEVQGARVARVERATTTVTLSSAGYTLVADDGAVHLEVPLPTVTLFPTRPLPTATDGLAWVGRVQVDAGLRATADKAGLTLTLGCADLALQHLSMPAPGAAVALAAGALVTTASGAPIPLPPRFSATWAVVGVDGDRSKLVGTDGDYVVTGYAPTAAVKPDELGWGTSGGVFGGEDAQLRPEVTCTAPVALRAPNGDKVGEIAPGTALQFESRREVHLFPSQPAGIHPPVDGWTTTAAALDAAGCADRRPKPPSVALVAARLAAMGAEAGTTGWSWTADRVGYEGPTKAGYALTVSGPSGGRGDLDQFVRDNGAVVGAERGESAHDGVAAVCVAITAKGVPGLACEVLSEGRRMLAIAAGTRVSATKAAGDVVKVGR